MNKHWFAVMIAALGLACSTASVAATPQVGAVVDQEGSVILAIEDDFQHHRAVRRYFVKEAGKPEVEVQISETVGKKLHTGDKIRVHGRWNGKAVDATSSDGSVQVLSSVEVSAVVPTQIKKALVILVDMQDGNGALHPISSTCDGTTNASANIMFGLSGTGKNVDGCYADASYNNLGFGGASYPGSVSDVVRVKILEPSTNFAGACNYTAWANAADQAAAAQVGLANYQHKIYVVPTGTGCTWAGLGYVGCGTSCRSWIAAYTSQVCGYPDAYAHELGHNIGMSHSSTDTNNDGVVDCEYCDNSDIMGYASNNLRTENAAHKVQMGWMPSGSVVNATAGGSYTLSALELTGAPYPQVLKITPTTGKPYYLSYRAPIGYDNALASTYTNKLNIVRYDSGNTLWIGALVDGQSFTDAANNLTFTQVGHGVDTALVTVSNSSAPVCTPATPLVAYTTGSQTATSLPAMRSYSFTVTNRDSEACASSAISLRGLVPTGWTGTLSSPSLTLAPGQTGSASIAATAPAGTANGTYAVQVGSAADATHPASAYQSASFVVNVATVDTTAPTVPGSLTAKIASGRRVTLNWKASTDASGIASYQVYRNGVLVGSVAGTSLSYVETPGVGTWSYQVKAVDKAGNVSAGSNIVSAKTTK